jgi:hypothetical protein
MPVRTLGAYLSGRRQKKATGKSARKDGTMSAEQVGHGHEIVWRLQHVWPKGMTDLTEIDLNHVDDEEARRLVAQVEDVKRDFERFVADEVVPRIPRRPTRVGVVETLRLFTSGFSMNTDYLLLVSGVLAGDGGTLQLIAERYTMTATDLGRFGELQTYTLVQTGQLADSGG